MQFRSLKINQGPAKSRRDKVQSQNQAEDTDPARGESQGGAFKTPPSLGEESPSMGGPSQHLQGESLPAGRVHSAQGPTGRQRLLGKASLEALCLARGGGEDGCVCGPRV